MAPDTVRCEYRFGSCERTVSLSVPPPPNFEEPVQEYVSRLERNRGLPSFLRNAVATSCDNFIIAENRDNRSSFFAGCEALLEQAINFASDWDAWYSDETGQARMPTNPSQEEVFSEVYHDLLHSARPGSGGLVPILQKEQTTASDLSGLVCDRDKDLTETKERHTTEMQNVMDNLEAGLATALEVNAVAERHHNECEIVQNAWDTQIRCLHETRREEFRSWILSLRIDDDNDGVNVTDFPMPYAEFPNDDFDRSRLLEGKRSMKRKNKFWRESSEASSGRTSLITSPSSSSLVDQSLEESFTIQLGAQMKQTHNLRLLAAGPFSLCRTKIQSERNPYPDPMRMHTAMSLYSDKLHGVILFVDNRISSFSGKKKEFASICETGPEFHFAPLEEQLEAMRGKILPEALDWRQRHTSAVASSGIAMDPSVVNAVAGNIKYQMTQGDFYVTTHSNLAQVHVVFHLVADNETILSGDAISSRHPVILGLRNILKACSLADITTLSIPLFLTPEMAEEMTIPWCVKRAELVFKCMKGFMMEMASWGGSLITTLQFLVPEDVTDSLFHQLAALLPSVFRVSNPLVMKSASK